MHGELSGSWESPTSLWLGRLHSGRGSFLDVAASPLRFSHTVSGEGSEGASVSARLLSQLLASLEPLPRKVFIDRGLAVASFLGSCREGRRALRLLYLFQSVLKAVLSRDAPYLTSGVSGNSFFCESFLHQAVFFCILAILQSNGPLFCFVFLAL